jgi:transposase
MMTQEEFMDVKRMHDEGMTFTEIAEATGYHRTTIAKWIRAGGPPEKRAAAAERVVLTDRWQRRIEQLVAAHPALLSTSIHDLLVAEGFDGSYVTVARAVRAIRGPRFKAARSASMPIETAPGAEAQFDFADVSDAAQAWGWTDRLWCFGMILCWSRWRCWWFTTSVDREHTFEGIIRFLTVIRGVPRIARTDRMGALGSSQGRRFKLHPPTVAFARHHGMVIAACQAGDAKRKGKVERPFRQLREGFLAEQHLHPPASIDQLNDRAAAWLDRRVHAVTHRVTKIPPAERLAVERGLLLPLPPVRFDTAYRAARRVHPAIPLINWRGVRYSVPTRALGQTVEVHQPVDSRQFTVRWAGQTIATHTQQPSGADDVWDPDHHDEATRAALTAATGRHLHPVRAQQVDAATSTASGVAARRLDVGEGYDVATPDLTVYGHGCECTGVSS